MSFNNLKEISTKQLHDEIEKGRLGQDLVVLDVREPFEWQDGRMDGATFISMNDVPNHLDELDRDKEIAVICKSGGRSYQVAAYLQSQGFKNVENVSGGMMDWQYNRFPTIRGK